MKKISLSKETLRVLTAQEAADVAGGALVTRRDDCTTETRPATGCGTATGACPSAACPTNTCPTNGCPTTTSVACPPTLTSQCPEPTQVCPETRNCPV